jgi:hypothetical protein
MKLRTQQRNLPKLGIHQEIIQVNPSSLGSRALKTMQPRPDASLRLTHLVTESIASRQSNAFW